MPTWENNVSVIASHTQVAGSVITQQRRLLRTYIRTLMTLDVVVMALTVLGSTTIVRSEHLADDTGTPLVLVGSLIAVGWLAALRLAGSYVTRNIGYGPEEYRRTGAATLRVMITIAIADYIFSIGIGSFLLIVCFAIGLPLLLTGRWAARRSLHRARARGRGWSHRVLVVGDAPHVIELVGQLRREAWTGYRVVGACLPETNSAVSPTFLGDVHVLGNFRTIVEAATKAEADTTAITSSAELTPSRLRRLGWQLEGAYRSRCRPDTDRHRGTPHPFTTSRWAPTSVYRSTRSKR